MVRPTWAPEGQTPVHYSWDRHDRLSALSALTVSARRNRLGRYFDIHDHNIVTEDLVWFAEQILARLQCRIILLTDRRPGHRSGAAGCSSAFPSGSGSSGCRPMPRSSILWRKYGTEAVGRPG